MKATEYLDAVKAELRVESDYALAKRLHVRPQAISNYRVGRSVFDNAMAARVAKILKIDLDEVIIDMELERANSPAEREFWKRFKDAAMFAVVIIGAASFGMLVSPQPAQAGDVLQRSLCQIRKGLPAWLRWLL